MAPDPQPSRPAGPDARTRLTPAPLPQAPLDAAQRLACLRLIRSDNVGPVTFRELINHFGGAEPALAALPELSRRGGRQAIRICPREAAEAELEAADRIGARPLFTIEPGYPPALAAVDAPPPLLYVKGDIAHLTRPIVAIVGARNASAAGQKLARMFAARIGERGLRHRLGAGPRHRPCRTRGGARAGHHRRARRRPRQRLSARACRVAGAASASGAA